VMPVKAPPVSADRRGEHHGARVSTTVYIP
jgi:hypothetical protein